MSTSQNPLPKLRELNSLLAAKAPFVLAFSGGLDSRFLAHSARLAGLEFQAAHVRGPHVPAADSEAALAWLAGRGISCIEIEFNPLLILEVAEGSRERCYACKRAMFREILARAGKLPVLEGSNASDSQKFRPGIKALRELGVLSPLARAGLTKPEIRALAAQTGLEHPNQPSRPCLLTRLDYGVYPNDALLAGLEHAEAAIAAHGFKNFRLRLFQDKPPLLQIDWQELPQLEAKRARLEQILTLHGYEGADIEAEIELSGYFDQQGETKPADDDLEILRNLF